MKHNKNITWKIVIGSEQASTGVDTFTLDEGSRLSISNTFDADIFLNIKSDTPWELVLLNNHGHIAVETNNYSAKVPSRFNQIGRGGKPGKDLTLRDLKDREQSRDFMLRLGHWTLTASKSQATSDDISQQPGKNEFSLQRAGYMSAVDSSSESDLDMNSELSLAQRLSLKTSELFGSEKQKRKHRLGVSSSNRRLPADRKTTAEGSSNTAGAQGAGTSDFNFLNQDDRHLSTPVLKLFSIGLLTLGIALLLFNLPKYAGTERQAETANFNLDGLLMEKSYASVLKETDPSGQIYLTGYVNTNAQLNALKQSLASNSISVKQDVISSDSLVAAAEDIFRVNAIDAEVSSSGPGVIDIISYANDTQKVRMIENEINESLRLKVAVAVENQVPVVYENKKPRQVPVFDDQKRITLVVAGDEGYVMTADESRYFIGSTLPSGHQITKITGSQVHIKKQDESITLNFN